MDENVLRKNYCIDISAREEQPIWEVIIKYSYQNSGNSLISDLCRLSEIMGNRYFDIRRQRCNYGCTNELQYLSMFSTFQINLNGSSQQTIGENGDISVTEIEGTNIFLVVYPTVAYSSGGPSHGYCQRRVSCH